MQNEESRRNTEETRTEEAGQRWGSAGASPYRSCGPADGDGEGHSHSLKHVRRACVSELGRRDAQPGDRNDRTRRSQEQSQPDLSFLVLADHRRTLSLA
jgi:hypothetical protein